MGRVEFVVRIYDFRGVRPERSAAQSVAAVPYDVVTADEARAIIADNPESFLRVSRPDAQLPGLAPDDPRVYQQAAKNFSAFMEDGRMKMDPTPALYLYQVHQDGDTFLGLCCCLDVEDYRNNTIRRHEQTRYDKEEDRTRHIEAVKAHNGPVVLLYKEKDGIFSFLESLVSSQREPVTEVNAGAGAIHRIYAITDPDTVERIKSLFFSVGTLYIADGHHRAKSAVNVVDRRIAAGIPADGEVTRFMGVMFAHDRVKIHGYSRLLADLGSYTPATFMHRLEDFFTVRRYGTVNGNEYNIRPRINNPEKYHVVHMYLEGCWYECTRPIDPGAPPLESLDVAVLQKHVLETMLGITDPRGDARLQYLGGARPVSDLETPVDSGQYRLAFAMQPVNVETVMSIADENGVMPPKSTWFEPKLLSGLVVHVFD